MLTDTFFVTLVVSALAGVVTTVGIFVIRRYESWGKAHAARFMSFAAGVLIAVSFIHIIPEALEMNGSASVGLLVGFLGLYLINRFLNTYVCHEFNHSDYALGIIPTMGVGLHSFLDGVIYSVTFSASVFTGALSAIGMVMHEFPEGIVTFVLLERGGFDRRWATRYALLAAAVSTPLGTLISYPFISRIGASSLGFLLAISAGALLYVGATHLLPIVEQENAKYSLVSLAAGMLVAVMIVVSKG